MNPTYSQILDAIASLPWKKIQGKEGVYLGDLMRFFHANNKDHVRIKEKLLSMELRGDIILLHANPPDDSHIIAIRLKD